MALISLSALRQVFLHPPVPTFCSLSAVFVHAMRLCVRLWCVCAYVDLSVRVSMHVSVCVCGGWWVGRALGGACEAPYALRTSYDIADVTTDVTDFPLSLSHRACACSWCCCFSYAALCCAESDFIVAGRMTFIERSDMKALTGHLCVCEYSYWCAHTQTHVSARLSLWDLTGNRGREGERERRPERERERERRGERRDESRSSVH